MYLSKMGWVKIFTSVAVMSALIMSVAGDEERTPYTTTEGIYNTTPMKEENVALEKEITYCTNSTYNKTCCNSDEFQCSDGYCIPSVKLCDFKFDCPDSSDENGCYSVACKDRVATKCQQGCVDIGYNKSRCVCYKGFSLRTTPQLRQTCQDIDECEIGVHYCTQDCVNLNGTFGCSCREGFNEAPSNNSLPGVCKADDRNIMVLYSSDLWIYGYQVDKHKVTPVVYSGPVDQMDFEPASNMIYWSTRHRVARSFLPGAENGKVTIGNAQPVGPSSIWHVRNSLAIDWTAGNIYWISADILAVNKYQILASKLDGRYRRTIVGEVAAATSLVVDPEHGKMYWTSGGDNPEIGMSWMNGMYRRSLIKLPGTNPVCLTLDHLSNGRLYWSDTKSNTIYTVFTDGSRLTSIIKTSKEQSVLSMDVFENYLYWITRESNELVRTDKLGRGPIIPLVQHLINQTSLKVVHPRRVEVEIRRSSLYCRDQCSHLCLHVPRGYSCSCPDGSRLLLQAGEILCDAEKEQPLNPPVICDCRDGTEILCNGSRPEHKCHCPQVKCQGLNTQTEPPPGFDDEETAFSSPSPAPTEYDVPAELLTKSKWRRIEILLLALAPVLLCFILSFYKRPQRPSVVQATASASIYRDEDMSYSVERNLITPNNQNDTISSSEATLQVF